MSEFFLPPEPQAPGPDTFEADLEADLAAALADPAPAITAEPDEPDDEDDPTPSPSVKPVTQRALDASVLAVLREEAAHEAAARRAETVGLEMQGDLGLPPPVSLSVGKAAFAAPSAPVASAQTETEKRLAHLKGEVAPPTKPAARRDLLPDIEEINSTLSPSATNRRGRDEVDDLPDLMGAKRQGSGFRSGFVLMLVLAGFAMALYAMAPLISQQIPGASAAMDTYVAAVDAGRIWLDGLIRQATGALNGISGNSG